MNSFDYLKIFILLLLPIAAYGYYGGTIAQPEDFSSSVRLIIFYKDSTTSSGNNAEGCTGVFIDENKILTAAHCLNHSNIYEIIITQTIKFGESIENANKVQYLKRFETFMHPKYEVERSKNVFSDLGILIVKEEISINFSIAELAYDLPKGIEVIVGGFGLNYYPIPNMIIKDNGKNIATKDNLYDFRMDYREVFKLNSKSFTLKTKKSHMQIDFNENFDDNPVHLFLILPMISNLNNVLEGTPGAVREVIKTQLKFSHLMQGDSGGPVYIFNNNKFKVVGINSSAGTVGFWDFSYPKDALRENIIRVDTKSYGRAWINTFIN